MADTLANKYHERFLHVLDLLGIKYVDVAEKTGISKDSFYTSKSAGRTPSFETLFKIKTNYPQINLDYLISGMGKPILGVSEYVEVKTPVKTKVNEPAEQYGSDQSVLQKVLQRFIESNEAQVKSNELLTQFLQEHVS